MKKLTITAATTALVLLGAFPALACGGLVAQNGTVQLGRTTTLAAYHAGSEHYVTSFQFAGGGEFGSIVPLPGVPSNVERGGDWTLQRLVREVRPPVRSLAAFESGAKLAADAKVLFETRIDALDITILEGGGAAVGKWAKDNGFGLSPDAPEVLDFYSDRSPIFMAAKFDAEAASGLGQNVGDGTPIHLTIPTENPWVPLRILALGKDGSDIVEADVFLLTPGVPELGAGLEFGDDGIAKAGSRPASESLLADLRSDKGMDWVPDSMWLTHLTIDAPAGNITGDLAIDVRGQAPSTVDAGVIPAAAEINRPDEATGLWPLAVIGFAIALAMWRGARWLGRSAAV